MLSYRICLSLTYFTYHNALRVHTCPRTIFNRHCFITQSSVQNKTLPVTVFILKITEQEHSICYSFKMLLFPHVKEKKKKIIKLKNQEKKKKNLSMPICNYFSAQSSLLVIYSVDLFQRDRQRVLGSQLPFFKARLCKGAVAGRGNPLPGPEPGLLSNRK